MPKKTVKDESVLLTAAQAVGTAAGKIAAFAGVKAEPPTLKSRIGKLVKKIKTRLPRREKKAAQKIAAKKKTAKPASKAKR